MAYQKRNRWVVCDVCGGQERFNSMRKGVSDRQKGWKVCPLCYDPPTVKRKVNIKPKTLEEVK